MSINMDEVKKLQEELERWKIQSEKMKNEKTTLYLKKVALGDKQEELQKELDDLVLKKKRIQDDIKKQQDMFREELLDLQMKRDDLEEDETEIKKKLSENEKVFRKFQDTLMIKSQLPQKNLNFKGINSAENADDEPMDIAYTCHIIASEPFVLEGGQALLTFENEQVAKSVIAKRKHPLDINDKKVFVEVQEPPLGKSVKFEVNMNISNKKLKVSNLPQDLPEETIKDKVELTFYKSGIGGGEIKNVDYDRNNNTAYVTYLQNGVAQRVLKENSYQLMAGKDTHEVEVEPCMYIELNKLQMFSSVSSRSVLITGIKNVDDEEEEDVKDLIELHFQKESNGGGEVESIAFSQDRKIKPIFEEDLK